MKKILILTLLTVFIVQFAYSKVTIIYPENDSTIRGTQVELKWKIDGNRPNKLMGYKIYVENNGIKQVRTSKTENIVLSNLKKGETYYWEVKCIFPGSLSMSDSYIGVVKQGVTALNFRPKPSTKCSPKYAVSGGEQFEILDKQGNWVKVKLSKNGDIGWLYSSYLETKKSNPFVSGVNRFYTAGAGNSKITLEDAIIVSGPSDLSKLPDTNSKTIKFKKPYTLWAVLKTKNKDGKVSYYLGYQNDGKKYPDTVLVGKNKTPLKVDRWNKELNGTLQFEWGKLFARLKHKNFKSVSDINEKYRSQFPNDPYPWFTNVIPNGENEGKWRNEDFKKMKWACEKMEYYEVKYFKPSLWERVRTFFGRKKSNPEWSIPAICLSKGGTVRYNVKIIITKPDGNQQLISSNGWFTEPFNSNSTLNKKAYKAGIKKSVHRISYLGNTKNPLINGIFAFSTVPWLYGSGNIFSTHQSDDFIGFDCADLVMAAYHLNVDKNFKIRYGANYLAKNIAVSKGYKYLNFVRKGAIYEANGNPIIASSDIIVDDKGNQFVIKVGNGKSDIKPGDLIFFDWDRDGRMNHTTVFYKEGKRAKGILSVDDYILMASHKGVTIRRIQDEVKYDLPTRFFLRKFKKL